jgi:His/Glu/Gln/Arg/opine family amino acid ABC transporter permease subunit
MQVSGLQVLFQGNNLLRLLKGLLVTINISLVSILISVVLGFLFGFIMISRFRVIRFISQIYLEFIRIMPQLVLLFLVYFGGIKLGAGGLIRAYAGSVANALKEIGIVEVKEQEGLKLTLSYPQYQTFSNFLQAENLQEFDTEFLENVTTHIYLDPENVQEVSDRLVEFYQGKVSFEKSGSKIVEVAL